MTFTTKIPTIAELHLNFPIAVVKVRVRVRMRVKVRVHLVEVREGREEEVSPQVCSSSLNSASTCQVKKRDNTRPSVFGGLQLYIL